MTDEFDNLFSDLSDEVADGGFTDVVMKRVRRPQRIRRAGYTFIYLMLGMLLLGPLADILRLTADGLIGLFAVDLAGALPSPTVFGALLLGIVAPLLAPVLQD